MTVYKPNPQEIITAREFYYSPQSGSLNPGRPEGSITLRAGAPPGALIQVGGARPSRGAVKSNSYKSPPRNPAFRVALWGAYPPTYVRHIIEDPLQDGFAP